MQLKNREQKVDLEKNKSAYIKKMGRQVKEIEESIEELGQIAQERQAEENTQVQKDLERVKRKRDEVVQQFEGLKNQTGKSWPGGSRDISAAYKELEGLIGTARSRVKRK